VAGTAVFPGSLFARSRADPLNARVNRAKRGRALKGDSDERNRAERVTGRARPIISMIYDILLPP